MGKTTERIFADFQICRLAPFAFVVLFREEDVGRFRSRHSVQVAALGFVAG